MIADINEFPTLPLPLSWDFVEANFPNYSSSDWILHANDFGSVQEFGQVARDTIITPELIQGLHGKVGESDLSHEQVAVLEDYIGDTFGAAYDWIHALVFMIAVSHAMKHGSGVRNANLQGGYDQEKFVEWYQAGKQWMQSIGREWMLD